jgi:hypothetical protein
LTALLTSDGLLFVRAAENGLVTGLLYGGLLRRPIARLVLTILTIRRLLAIRLLCTIGCLILLVLRHILPLRGKLSLRGILSLGHVLPLRLILSLREILPLRWILSLRWILLIRILRRRISCILSTIRRLPSIGGLRGIASLCGWLAVIGLGVRWQRRAAWRPIVGRWRIAGHSALVIRHCDKSLARQGATFRNRFVGQEGRMCPLDSQTERRGAYK